jgi:valyl-tRNA synthetase
VEAAKTEIFSEDAEKKQSALAVMDVVLSAVVRLLHPFMPHITEELWSLLGLGQESIQFASPPEELALGDIDLAGKRKVVSGIYEIVQAGRNLRAEAKIPSSKKANFVLRSDSADIEAELSTAGRLLNADEMKLDRQYKPGTAALTAVTSLGDIFLIISRTDKAAESDRLDKEIARVEGELRTVKAKLENKSFVDRAPAAVVEEHRQRQQDFSEQLAKLQKARESLDL